MKKRIAITGGTGFIGQSLICLYGEEFDFVVPTSRNSIDGLSSKAKYIVSDYSEASFKEIFCGCDSVVHFGGYVIQGSDKELITKPYIDNISLASAVFSACKELGITNVICGSSVAVYDQNESHPLKEDSLLKPNSMYGICKVAVEQVSDLYNSMYGMCIKNLRFAQVLGYKKHIPTRFYGMLFNNAFQGVPITVWGQGIAARDIIYVKDAARATVAALNHPSVSGCFNIGMGRAVSNMELAEAYTEGFQSVAPVLNVPTEKEDTHRWCVDCEKARKELGFVYSYSVLEMARDMLAEAKKDMQQ